MCTGLGFAVVILIVSTLTKKNTFQDQLIQKRPLPVDAQAGFVVVAVPRPGVPVAANHGHLTSLHDARRPPHPLAAPRTRPGYPRSAPRMGLFGFSRRRPQGSMPAETPGDGPRDILYGSSGHGLSNLPDGLPTESLQDVNVLSGVEARIQMIHWLLDGFPEDLLDRTQIPPEDANSFPGVEERLQMIRWLLDSFPAQLLDKTQIPLEDAKVLLSLQERHERYTHEFMSLVFRAGHPEKIFDNPIDMLTPEDGKVFPSVEERLRIIQWLLDSFAVEPVLRLMDGFVEAQTPGNMAFAGDLRLLRLLETKRAEERLQSYTNEFISVASRTGSPKGLLDNYQMAPGNVNALPGVEERLQIIQWLLAGFPETLLDKASEQSLERQNEATLELAEKGKEEEPKKRRGWFGLGGKEEEPKEEEGKTKEKDEEELAEELAEEKKEVELAEDDDYWYELKAAEEGTDEKDRARDEKHGQSAAKRGWFGFGGKKEEPKKEKSKIRDKDEEDMQVAQDDDYELEEAEEGKDEKDEKDKAGKPKGEEPTKKRRWFRLWGKKEEPKKGKGKTSEKDEDGVEAAEDDDDYELGKAEEGTDGKDQDDETKQGKPQRTRGWFNFRSKNQTPNIDKGKTKEKDKKDVEAAEDDGDYVLKAAEEGTDETTQNGETKNGKPRITRGWFDFRSQKQEPKMGDGKAEEKDEEVVEAAEDNDDYVLKDAEKPTALPFKSMWKGTRPIPIPKVGDQKGEESKKHGRWFGLVGKKEEPKKEEGKAKEQGKDHEQAADYDNDYELKDGEEGKDEKDQTGGRKDQEVTKQEGRFGLGDQTGEHRGQLPGEELKEQGGWFGLGDQKEDQRDEAPSWRAMRRTPKHPNLVNYQNTITSFRDTSPGTPPGTSLEATPESSLDTLPETPPGTSLETSPESSPDTLTGTPPQTSLATSPESSTDTLPDESSEFQRTLSTQAAAVKEKVVIAQWKVLEQVNMCKEEKQQKVAERMAAIRSQVVQVAEFGVAKWPEVKENTMTFARWSRQTVVDLAQKLNQVRMTVWQHEKTQYLMNNLRVRFGRLQMWVLSNRPEYVVKAQENMGGFLQKVSELSATLATAVKDWYQSEDVQNALARVQAAAGQLMQLAAAKWPSVRRSIGVVAVAVFVAIRKSSARVLDFMCNPENHKRAKLIISKVMEFTKKIINNIKKRFPQGSKQVV